MLRPSTFALLLSNRALHGTRPPGLQVRNLSLYPLSYERVCLGIIRGSFGGCQGILAVTGRLRQDSLEQQRSAFLVQRLVVVATLGRLHAGWAAFSAGAGCDHLLSHLE